MTWFVSEGIAAGYEIDWDDPFAVGIQTSKPHQGAWCHRCHTGNHWSWVPILWAWVRLDVCWWCNGPMEELKPVRTQQTQDRTVAETHLEPTHADDRNLWEAQVAAELARIYGERSVA